MTRAGPRVGDAEAEALALALRHRPAEDVGLEKPAEEVGLETIHGATTTAAKERRGWHGNSELE